MLRRAFLAGLAAALALPRPVVGQGVDVTAINDYLLTFRNATGRFRQRNPNGSQQAGTFYLAKPGRIRFEYEQPAGAMVISDGSWVGVFDPKSNRNPQRYPLSQTPLSVLLRENISLREPGLVLGATRDAAGTHITVVDPRAPDQGRMVMTFGSDPVVLRQWQITTRTGQTTEVALATMRTGLPLDRSLFNIELAALDYR